MSSPADKMLKDGILEFSGGQDAGRSPSDIDQNQVAFAVNSTFRGGKWRQRPAFIKHTLDFASNGVKTAFEQGRFQHASFFDGTDHPYGMSSHGGRIFRTDLKNFKVEEVTPATGANSGRKRIGWSVQAENFWIYQDNQSYPIIFDGASSRRANPALNEVPVGNVMCYAFGRLIVALPDRVSYRVGDIVFGASDSTDTLLKFTETMFLNEGGDFVAHIYGAPSGFGEIRSMKPMAMTNTQLGQGPVMIGQERTVFTINLPFDRTVWKNLNSPLQTASPVMGPLGQDSTVLVNCDMWYRSQDGIRSYILALQNFGTIGANAPMSSEVSSTLDYDTKNLLEFGSGVLFDNRLIETCSPVPGGVHGVWHRGFEVIDFDLVSNLRLKEPAAWEGLWTGIRILKVILARVDQEDRCFIYSINTDNKIELWEMVLDAITDEGGSRITRSADLKSMNCGDPFQLKNLQTGELFIDKVQGVVDITVKYRSDQNPCWQPWDTFPGLCAKNETCLTSNADCAPIPNLQPQFRSKLKLHNPADNNDVINGRKYKTGYEFQPRIEITGACEVKQVRILAVDEKESAHGERTTI